MQTRVLARVVAYDPDAEKILLVRNKGADYWYVGGGCFGFEDFHVEQRREEGFISYTPAASGTGWAFDRIGSSGLADTGFADGIDRLLDSIHDYVFRRWLTWTDEGIPDLQNSVKRRLNCERRRVIHLSAGFDYDLLTFMSPRWPISLTFGPEAELPLQRDRREGVRRHL